MAARGLNAAADTRLRAVACQTGLTSPASVMKGTPLRDDASRLAFGPVGAGWSVEHAVISATVRSAAAVRATVRGALSGDSVKRTGMLSPCAMYALRLATDGRSSQAKNQRGDCVRHGPTQPGFAIGSAQDIGDHWRQLALDFLAAEVPHDSG